MTSYTIRPAGFEQFEVGADVDGVWQSYNSYPTLEEAGEWTSFLNGGSHPDQWARHRRYEEEADSPDEAARADDEAHQRAYDRGVAFMVVASSHAVLNAHDLLTPEILDLVEQITEVISTGKRPDTASTGN
jgi:hypothetical protein